MKQKDYIIIGLIVFLGAILSFGISKLFISGENTIQKVEVVEPISAEFKLPDTKYFNKDAFDPTQVIKIQNNNNTAPFTNSAR